MKELKNFRQYLNEEINIGDMVKFKGSDDSKMLKVTEKRKMFASDLMAYMVKFPDGKEAEYDETQLELVNESLLTESTPGYDTRKSGESLPTLETVQAAYEAKQANLKEGTWAMGNPDDIRLFIRKIEELEEDYSEVVGNDDVLDGLGRAKKGAEFVLKMALQKNS